MVFGMGLQEGDQVIQGRLRAFRQLVAGQLEQDAFSGVIDLFLYLGLYFRNDRASVIFGSARGIRAFVLFVIYAIPVPVRYRAALVTGKTLLMGALVFFIV